MADSKEALPFQSLVDQVKLQKLAKRVEEYLEKLVINKEPKQLDPRLLLVAPLNREGAPPNLQHIHRVILKCFLEKGFDRTRPQIGICIEFKSEAGKKKLLEHNHRFSTGCQLLPPIHEEMVLCMGPSPDPT